MGRWCSDSSRDGGGDATVPKASETPAASHKGHCTSSEAGRPWSVKQESHTAVDWKEKKKKKNFISYVETIPETAFIAEKKDVMSN